VGHRSEHFDEPDELRQARWWYGSIPRGVRNHDHGAELRQRLDQAPASRSWPLGGRESLIALALLLVLAAAVVGLVTG
jgi:hypothetical protein